MSILNDTSSLTPAAVVGANHDFGPDCDQLFRKRFVVCLKNQSSHRRFSFALIMIGAVHQRRHYSGLAMQIRVCASMDIR